MISIHAPRGGCDGGETMQAVWQHERFQSTHPVGGATPADHGGYFRTKFQSTHPVGGATISPSLSQAVTRTFQSTHPVGGATRGKGSVPQAPRISIHAPRGGCDHCRQGGGRKRGDFNPRTPWGVRRTSKQRPQDARYFNPRTPWGVRREAKDRCHKRRGFQSTHPVGGATIAAKVAAEKEEISIHAPRGGCDAQVSNDHKTLGISIHAPRGGCDRDGNTAGSNDSISIHAPRGGCDLSSSAAIASSTYFNPRTPWGVRRGPLEQFSTVGTFQSTHPVGGATWPK